MILNIDDIIARLIGWNLQLTVGGKTVAVRPPDAALIDLAKRFNAGGMTEREIVAALRQALAGIVDGEIANWSTPALISALCAIFEHAKQTRGKSIAGLGQAVRAAMRPEVPASPAHDEVSGQAGAQARQAPFDERRGPAGSQTRQAAAS
jgi:hypothetical protein